MTELSGKDVKYLRIAFNYLSSFEEALLDADGKEIHGYFDGDDDPCLFPHVGAHPFSYDGPRLQSKTLIVDVKTGHIVNWKPFTIEELDATIENWEDLRQEAIINGDYDDF